MRRVFTVELAVAVHRMARLSGVTPDRTVQLLYRSSLFDAAVSLSTGVWSWFDERARTYVRNRRQQQWQFVKYIGSLVKQGVTAERLPTIQYRTGVAPRQA